MKKKITAAAITCSILFTLGAGSAFADTKLDKIVDTTIGTTYKYGGISTKGFDCSGFTMYVFNKMGIELPHQSGAQYKMGTAVDKSDLRAGDLVFFNTSGQGVSHVGIMVSEGKFAHASTSKGVIISKLSEDYYANRYVSAKRIISNDVFTAYADDSIDNDDVE